MDEGRALDALIAERVMGLKPEEWPWRCHEEGHTMDENIWCFDCQKLYSEGERIPPRYSTDVGSAFDVVEKMHERIFAHSCAPAGEVPQPWPNANYLTLVSLGGAPDSGYAAAFTCVAMCDDDVEWFENPEKYGGASGTSPAHAICLAALAALNAEHPEPSHVV